MNGTVIHETLPWSRKAWGSFTCRRSHGLFSSIPCTQTPTILPMDFQIQSCSTLRFVPFRQIETWNRPEITNLPANPPTVLKPNIQTSVGPIEFPEQSGVSWQSFIQLMWLTLPAVGMMEKINLHLDVKRPQPPKPQTTEMIKLENIFLNISRSDMKKSWTANAFSRCFLTKLHLESSALFILQTHKVLCTCWTLHEISAFHLRLV